MKKALFIFRRDLRLQDNTALNAALKEAETIHLAFIFDPAQKNHPYFSEAGFQFMTASLTELASEAQAHQGTINFLMGKPLEVLESLKAELNFEAVYVNKDYTPFAGKRDEKLKKWCKINDINFKDFDDSTLNSPEAALKEDGSPYKVFTPYYKNALQIKVMNPHTEKLNKISDHCFKKSLPLEDIVYSTFPAKNKNLLLKGGRKEALNIYQNFNKNYDEERDFPGFNSTTHLSAHHKFGTVSMRESYYAIGNFYGFTHTVISELYWHDFFTHIGYFYPHVFKRSFTPKFENLPWENDNAKFEAWCNGQTGVPIVDAGMRELNTTGYMHNRVRMIAASYLIKNLEVNWQWGERYFAQKLIDYDPAINNGNWQWAASTGVDAQPFFRIFNPWRQQERFDAQSAYIKKWIPELEAVPSKELNNWEANSPSLLTSYPAPIVQHKASSEKTKAKYKAAHEASKV